MVTLLDLPIELILHILWFLDLEDIVACQLTHQSLYAIIKDSVTLKYLRALGATGMEDNRCCTVWNMSERLDMLNIQEDVWATQLINVPQEIPSPADRTFFYTLNGGIYFFGSRRSLHYLSLPTKASNEVNWSYIDPGNDLKAVGFAIYEHDLVAIAVSSSDDEENPVYHILLFEAFTGTPHPLAQNPRISIPYLPISVIGGIKIAGNHLAIVSAPYWNDTIIYVYDWKMGILKMTIETPEGTYKDALFLSSTVLLAPNVRNNTLEFWHIPELPDVAPRTCPNGALALPPLKDRWIISCISCKCEPFFGLHETRYSSVPFYSSAVDAIAVFAIRAQLPGNIITFTVHEVFSMVMHHRSLALCPTSSSMRPDIGVDVVPWDKWGPTVTRLYHTDSISSRKISSKNSSQRYVFPWEPYILDFNPARIRSFKTMTYEHAAKREDMLNSTLVTSESLLDCRCFEKPVPSRLPYIQEDFLNHSAFCDISIDNERIVGLRFDERRITDFQIWHIGQTQYQTQ